MFIAINFLKKKQNIFHVNINVENANFASGSGEFLLESFFSI